jgi:putative hydrolase of HD superfamily
MNTGAARFLYEVGMLKRLARAGWALLGVPQPESVADHSHRTAVIGYTLACLEGHDPEHTAALCLFHDLTEARIGDRHALAKAHEDGPPSDERAWSALCDGLPDPLRSRLAELRAEYLAGSTREARLAHDADRLECLLQAREYAAQGVTGTDSFIATASAGLSTDAARDLARSCLETAPEQWWQRALRTGVRA